MRVACVRVCGKRGKRERRGKLEKLVGEKLNIHLVAVATFRFRCRRLSDPRDCILCFVMAGEKDENENEKKITLLLNFSLLTLTFHQLATCVSLSGVCVSRVFQGRSVGGVLMEMLLRL